MKLFLDQGIPFSAARELRAFGWDVVHAAEAGLSRATDAEILERARSQERVCVTLDADFHALLALHHARAPSVVRVRREGLNGSALAALLRNIWPRIEAQVIAGAVVTVTDRAIRLRRLPILGDD